MATSPGVDARRRLGLAEGQGSQVGSRCSPPTFLRSKRQGATKRCLESRQNAGAHTPLPCWNASKRLRWRQAQLEEKAKARPWRRRVCRGSPGAGRCAAVPPRAATARQRPQQRMDGGGGGPEEEERAGVRTYLYISFLMAEQRNSTSVKPLKCKDKTRLKSPPR